MVLEIDGMTEDDFFSNLKNRLKIYREPRQVMQTAIYVAAKNKWPDHVSFEIVGKMFEKNHSTIIHSVETVKDLHQTDKFYRGKYFRVFEYIRLINNDFLL
jgi:chromosomal replication initiation ATPase DnaA